MTVASGSDNGNKDNGNTKSHGKNSAVGNEQHPDEQNAQPETPAPGTQLRLAREALGLAREDVASELRLDLRVIKALEEDDLDHLPEPVFTAGYLRSYAKLVGLPADALIKQYVKTETRDISLVDHGITKLPERYRKVADVLPNNFSVSSSHHPHASNIKKQALLIVAMLLVVFISWQSTRWSSKESTPPATTGTAQTTEPTAPTTDTVAQSNTSVNDSATTGGQPSAAPVTTATQPAPEAPPGAQIQQALALKPVQETAAFTANEVGQEQADLLQLSLRFSANSWVDIRDSTGKRLIRELGFKGAEKQITGVAPFQVLLGYGPGVELEYNGKPYDFSEYQNRKVARFTLDVDAAAHLNISAPSSQPETGEGNDSAAGPTERPQPKSETFAPDIND